MNLLAVVGRDTEWATHDFQDRKGKILAHGGSTFRATHQKISDSFNSEDSTYDCLSAVLISRLTAVPGKGKGKRAVRTWSFCWHQYPASETISARPPLRPINAVSNFNPKPPGIGPRLVVFRPFVAQTIASSAERFN